MQKFISTFCFTLNFAEIRLQILPSFCFSYLLSTLLELDDKEISLTLCPSFILSSLLKLDGTEVLFTLCFTLCFTLSWITKKYTMLSALLLDFIFYCKRMDISSLLSALFTIFLLYGCSKKNWYLLGIFPK